MKRETQRAFVADNPIARRRADARARCSLVAALFAWLLCALFMGSATRAATLVWTGAVNDDFFNRLNWIDTSTGSPPAAPPSAVDAANINNASAFADVAFGVHDIGLVVLIGNGFGPELEIGPTATLNVVAGLSSDSGVLTVNGTLNADSIFAENNAYTDINGNANVTTDASFDGILFVGGALTAQQVSLGGQASISGAVIAEYLTNTGLSDISSGEVNVDHLSNSGLFDATFGQLNMIGALGSNRTIDNAFGTMRLRDASLENVYASGGLWELSTGQVDAFNDSRFIETLVFATGGAQLVLDDSQFNGGFADFSGEAGGTPTTLRLQGATGSTVTGGILQFTNGAVLDVQAGSLIDTDGSGSGEVRLLGGGALTGDGAVLSPVLSSGATVSPGDSIGTLTLGDYTQTGASILEIELGSSGFDVLDVTGVATLDGTLAVQLTGEFTPTSGQQFQVVNYASRVGEFSTITGLDIGGGMALFPSYEANGLVLSAGVPDLHFTGLAADRLWDSADNWSLGISPGAIHAVFVDPNDGDVVRGPSVNTSVSGLTIGTASGGIGITTLDLQGGSRLTVSTETTIESAGRLSGNGSLLSSGGIVNQGEIDVGSEALSLLSTTLTNHGVVRGSAMIAASIDNQASGEIRIAAGERMRFTGAANTNAGRIEVIGSDESPAEFELDTDLQNVTGEIVSRNAQLRFLGGLTNTGTMSLSFGTSDIFGDVENVGGGLIAVSGNSNATFYDDVTNNGELRTSDGSTTVFFGDVSGAGSYPGGGTVFYEGIFSPGSSPAEVNFGGDLTLTSSAKLEMELGGTTPGSEHDKINVAGTATLGGTLEVLLIDLGSGVYAPTGGESFEILTAAQGFLGTTFNVEILPALSNGLTWNVDYGATSVFLHVLSAFLEADFDQDGDVDGDDFLAWQGGFGTTTGAIKLDGDYDNDGDVDGDDFLGWQSEFGSGGGSTIGEVPEPSGAAMLLLTSAIFLYRRKLVACVKWK